MDSNVVLSLAILIFGLIVIFAVVGVQYKLGHGWGPYTTRITGITLVVVAALFLGAAGISEQILPAAFGLLGTIAGYLFGKSDQKE